MKFLKWFRNLSFVAITLQFAFHPLAMAQAQKSNVAVVKEFLKRSGLVNKKTTVGDFYLKVAPTLNDKQRKALQPYVALMQDELMPSVEPVTFMDSKKIEQVRLILNWAWSKKTYSLQTEGFGTNLKLRFNNAQLSEGDFSNPLVLLKTISAEVGSAKVKRKTFNDVSLVPSRAQWKAMTGLQRLQYLSMFRYVVEDVEKILSAKQVASLETTDPLEKFALIFEILNPEAHAKMDGKACTILGWASIYGDKRDSCASHEKGFQDLARNVRSQFEKSGYKNSANCVDNKQVPCNPLIYGFGANNQPFCLSHKETLQLKSGTKDFCKSKSPLRHDPKTDKELPRKDEVANIKKIVDSHLSALGINSSTKVENDTILASDSDYKLIEKYIKDMDGAIDAAIAACTGNTVPDQVEACGELPKRRIALTNFKVFPPQPPPQNVQQVAEQTQRVEDGLCKVEEAHLCSCMKPEQKGCPPAQQGNAEPGVTPPNPDYKRPSDEPGVTPPNPFYGQKAEAPAEEKTEGDDDGDHMLGLMPWILGGALMVWAMKKSFKTHEEPKAVVPVESPTTGQPPPGTATDSNPGPQAPPAPSSESLSSAPKSTTPTGTDSVRKPGTR